MKTIEIDGKSYLINIEKATKQGVLKEKGNKPRSWEEYRENILLYQRCKFSAEEYNFERTEDFSYKVFGSPEEAKAFCALGKLIQLRDAWWGNWKPDWSNSEDKYFIWALKDDMYIDTSMFIRHMLAFPTKEMANDFLITFYDLIKLAKIFL